MADQQQAEAEAQQKAEQVKSEAQQKAEHAKGKAQSKLREQFDQRSKQAGERVASNAREMRSIGDELRKQGKDKPAQYVDQASAKAEQLGDYLKKADADRVLLDVENFGRREPAVLVSGALALGFAASRLLKASSSKRQQQQQQQQQQAGRLAELQRAGTYGEVAPAAPPAVPAVEPVYEPAPAAPTTGASEQAAGVRPHERPLTTWR